VFGVRGFYGVYPIGTVPLYGPDDKMTTKVAAGVILYDGAEAIIKRRMRGENGISLQR